MTDFIIQGNDTTCRLVTLLNAHIWKHGKSPLEYGTKEYYEFYEGVNGHKRYLEKEAYDLINADFENFSGNGRTFFKWFHQHITSGNCIDMSSYCKNLHSFLVCAYDSYFDSYMCVNSQIYTKKIAVEWLPYPIIINGTVGKNTIKYFQNIKLNSITKSSSAIIFKK